jgi:hypothetical protein
MMTLLSLQDGLVTLIALGAGAILLRRVFGFAKQSSEPGCAHCTAAPVKRSTAPGTGSATTVFPLTLVRPDGAPRASSRS